MSKIVTVYTVRRTSATIQARNTVGDAVVDIEMVAEDEREAARKVMAASQFDRDAEHFNWRVVSARVLVVPEARSEEVEALQEKLNSIAEYLDRTAPMGEYVDPAPILTILKESV